jgi:hypothetical protein
MNACALETLGRILLNVFTSKKQTFQPVDTVQVVPLHTRAGEVAATERREICVCVGGGG